VSGFLENQWQVGTSHEDSPDDTVRHSTNPIHALTISYIYIYISLQFFVCNILDYAKDF
jgi:hypothetical protein